ncbi:PHD finger protein MALE STERILITY 1 [Apium graveolens]|uniref:PHD finger protein MALE STERILITY 1 n=1 Tax=Apium graveolens TaxID=4045 RepID=UPI003D7A3C10
MSNLDSINCKKRKRPGEKVYKFKTFGEQGCPTEFNHGSFRENIKALLEFGNTETVSWGGMASWSFQLQVQRNPPSHILLFVIEEPIELSLNPHCKHCLYVGWGDHIICKKKYHFLVPSKDTLAACLSYEGNNHNIGAGTDRVVKGKLNLIMELQGHILHGVFHSNGFGHLLCINGLEMGSDLPGYQVMDLWDRLSTNLQARKVSIKDTSQKTTMDLRLLYGIAYSEPWFARWGYEFGRGSFGVTKQMHQKAIEAIQTIPLCVLAHHATINNSNHQISIMVSKYQTVAGHSMKSLSDLFRFILELKSRLSKESSIDTCNPGILVDSNCRWSIKRVEMAIKVIIDSLKRADFRWISRQEVRDSARAYIGDTGLLDFVLKSLGNHIVGNYLVRRCLNPVTKVLEYCLEDISNVNFPHQDQGFSSDESISVKARYKISRIQLSKDLFYLYKHIVKEQNPTINSGITTTISLASRIILDSKYLIKEYSKKLPYKFEVGIGDRSKLYCTIALTNISTVHPRKVVAPYECITLGNNATFQELTLEVEKCFKDIYWGLRDFMVQTIGNMNAINVRKRSDDLVFRVLKAGSELVFEGNMVSYRGRNMIQENIFEGSCQNNICVDCLCGAKEDDGERMVSCDICEVWQHTRCVQIPNNEAIPSIFLCSRCEQDILVLPSIS